MNGKDDQNFFSTEDDYNKHASNNEKKVASTSGTEYLSEEYKKYLDYDDKDYDEILSSYENHREEKPSEPPKAKGEFFKKNNYKNLKIIIICLVATVVIAAGCIVAYLYHATKGADYSDPGVDYNHDAEDYVVEEDLNLHAMGDVSDASSLNDFLKSWSHNGGEKIHSKNVLNVLLCGIDTEDGTASGGRADAIILVSVNKKTKEIILSSFFRDSYIYMDIPQKDGTVKGRYEKLNAAYNYGGPAALIDTLEKNYKVEIDQYIAVDFASFTKLIDAVGGVTVDVEEREAMFIRRTSSHKSFPYGNNVQLSGSQALVYSRIRHLDSDINRTERQRKVIKSLIESAKTATNGQLVNAYKLTAKYIRTGYSQTDVISLIATAVTQGWMEYDMSENTYPSESGVEMISAYVNTTSARNQWVWLVDYPLCAQKLQNSIYGESNINLSADRISPLKYVNVKPTGGTKSSTNSTKSYSGQSTTHTTERNTQGYTGSTASSTHSSSTSHSSTQRHTKTSEEHSNSTHVTKPESDLPEELEIID